MNLSEELLIEIEFEKTEKSGYDMYKYCKTTSEELFLEKTHKEKEFYMIYKENSEDVLEPCGHCEDLESLIEMMMKINHISSMNLGKKIKQQEIKALLGI